MFFPTFKRLKTSCIVVLIAFFAVACNKKEVPSPAWPYGKEYFPLKTGNYVIYECDSTVYNDLPRDTIVYRFQLKERIGESFTDNEGGDAYRIERFVRTYHPSTPYDSIAWRMKEVWMLNLDQEKLSISEGNRRFTRLVFPVKINSSWNGNAQNSLGEEIYSYEYIDKKEKIKQQSFEKVLKVKQRDFKTLISYEGRAEKYASGIGLVSKESAEYYSNTIKNGVALEKRIEYGFIYKQNIVAHGTE